MSMASISAILNILQSNIVGHNFYVAIIAALVHYLLQTRHNGHFGSLVHVEPDVNKRFILLHSFDEISH